MEINVTFPGGKRVDAQVGRFSIATDQSAEHGGAGSAPEPFTLFLASLATCAGIYVVGFCQARNIPTDGIRLVQRSEGDPKGKLLRVEIDVHVPRSFPAHYHEQLARAAAACKVKKTMADPPSFEVKTLVDEAGVTTSV
jgi:ribosomal protein S12 methylthiotransferase accessory factor